MSIVSFTAAIAARVGVALSVGPPCGDAGRDFPAMGQEVPRC